MWIFYYKQFQLSLPGITTQLAFPSPSYPGIQEQLYDPIVFVQLARLEWQSWDPWLHSSISEKKKIEKHIKVVSLDFVRPYHPTFANT